MVDNEAARDTRIYTFKVTLKYSSPAIWRRFEVSDQITLGDLHRVLQSVMDWSDGHLHEFHINRKEYGAIQQDDSGFGAEPMNDEEEFSLCEVVKRKGAKLKYIYDFGDYWEHDLVLEDVSEPREGVSYPICLGGGCASPPEDCGGIDGYYHMLEVLLDPEDEDYEDYIEWFPGDFDPGAFNLAQVNAWLGDADAGRWIVDGEAGADDSVTTPAADRYQEPVRSLLTLGEPEEERDYSALGIGAEHVPDLVAMIGDRTLGGAKWGSPETWAPVHAWRALGKLHAAAAVGPLTNLLRLIDEDDDDWVAEELPDVLGEIGAEAIPALSAFMQDDSHGCWARVAASRGLLSVVEKDPETRDTCVAALNAVLDRYAENDEMLNAFIVSALVDLRAVESAPAMESAFAADTVDLGVLGDWEDVQVLLGLLDERITPRPALTWARSAMREMPATPHVPPPASVGKSHDKTKRKRKEQKKSRKKNRRK